MTRVSLPVLREPANYDEVSMQQSLLFSDSLKDLKNLRKQLYSAAEYFELSYTKDDQQQIVMETLKDYAIKALVNTVDHLGTVTCKVNAILGEKVDEVSDSELRLSCIQQRLRTCQEYIDREGLSQQSLVINTPKHHKRYILPAGEKTNISATRTKSRYQVLDDEDDWHQFRSAVRATISETPPLSSSARNELSPSPSPIPLQRSETFLFTGSTPKKELEKRAVSPYRFPLLRAGSRSSRPTTPNSRATTPKPSRPTTPNSRASNQISTYSSDPRRSASMRLRPGKEMDSLKDIEQHTSKSKRLLKALLSRRKSKKDEMLYTYLDEY